MILAVHRMKVALKDKFNIGVMLDLYKSNVLGDVSFS